MVSKVRPADKPVFSYVTLGDLRHFGNNDSLGQNAGCLGHAYDPFTIPFVRPMNGSLDVNGVTSVLSRVDGGRLAGRRELLDEIGRAAPQFTANPSTRNLDDCAQRAYELLSSTATRDAFDLGKEPDKVRHRYGPTPFAQNCLLARRLAEAGVPMVTLYSFGNRDWDTHSANGKTLKDTLLPPTDQGLSSLLDDLECRGMLDETLVVWMGDMGRTPRINRDGGRDHWSFCYSVVLAGGGVRGGQVYGASDRTAAYPSTNPVSPADIAATIYHCLGIDAHQQVADQEGRPFVIGTGKPISGIL